VTGRPPPDDLLGRLLGRLPEPIRARLRAVGAGHRTILGRRRDFQTAFDENIGLLDELIASGASHAELGLLLAEAGIARADGTPLPLGTISGALSRARERAAAARPAGDAAAPVAAPAAAAPPPQDPAGSGSAVPERAGHRTTLQRPAVDRRDLPHPADQSRHRGDDRTRRAAALLNSLRSRP
jgi:hypothetical protein